MTRAGTLFPLILLVLFPSLQSRSQERASFFASGERLVFKPLKAPAGEPRVGGELLLPSHSLRLDIGNAVDIVFFSPAGDERVTVSLGAEFTTWTALRREEHFHFPVDAVDYLFGMTVNCRFRNDSMTAYAVRVRFSHISAHLADGSYNKAEGSWRDGRVPLVFSREFIELLGAIEFGENIRLYAGGHYVYHIDPHDLFPWMFRAGLETTYTPSRAPWFHPYLAYDARLAGGREAVGNHTLQGGFKLGPWGGAGLRVFLTYFSGLSPHGEYHDTRISSWGPGFSIDF